MNRRQLLAGAAAAAVIPIVGVGPWRPDTDAFAAPLAVKHGAEFRRCLLELDADGIMRLWRHVAPHLPQPEDRRVALTGLHLARTHARSIPMKARRYSQRWLNERGAGSFLPDDRREKR